MLDVSSYEKALASLHEALAEYGKDARNHFVRDACIQRFEYSYELGMKMLRRYLEMTSDNPSLIDATAFADLIRTASEQGLLKSGWDIWKTFREARNITSHTYDEKKAAQVCAVIPSFIKEADFLLRALQSRSGAV